mgnify:CR=1 FL=1
MPLITIFFTLWKRIKTRGVARTVVVCRHFKKNVGFTEAQYY